MQEPTAAARAPRGGGPARARQGVRPCPPGTRVPGALRVCSLLRPGTGVSQSPSHHPQDPTDSGPYSPGTLRSLHPIPPGPHVPLIPCALDPIPPGPIPLCRQYPRDPTLPGRQTPRTPHPVPTGSLPRAPARPRPPRRDSAPAAKFLGTLPPVTHTMVQGPVLSAQPMGALGSRGGGQSAAAGQFPGPDRPSPPGPGGGDKRARRRRALPLPPPLRLRRLRAAAPRGRRRGERRAAGGAGGSRERGRSRAPGGAGCRAAEGRRYHAPGSPAPGHGRPVH